MSVFERVLSKTHTILNSDFCPWANRWVYWMKHPLACLVAAGIVAICCGVFVNPVAFVFLGVISLVAVLGAFWPWISTRGLSAEAEFVSTRCRLGQSIRVRLRIANRYPWPAWGLSVHQGFHTNTPETTRGSAEGIALARIGGWSETEFEWVFTPPHRGVYPLATPSVDTGFPFGLWYQRVPIDIRNELLVWPHSVPLEGLPDAAEIHSREDRFSDRRVGDCGDLVGIRPFRQGDTLRRIHWLQTARTGRLIVIERQAPAACAVRLLVDVDRNSHDFARSPSSLERVLTVAASVLVSLHRQHAFVELQIHEELCSVGNSERDLRRALDLLARIPVNGIACDHHCHFDRPSRQLPTMVVTTDVALWHHRGHRHVAAGERFVVIRTVAADVSSPVSAGCNCDAWIEVAADEVLDDVVAQRWQRACHVA